MTDLNQINVMMTDVGRLLELQEVIAFEEDAMWTLQVDDDTIVFADLEADQHRIILSAEVAIPHPARGPATYGLLLQYNNQWKATGGVRMALDGPDGTVVQICDVATNGLDAETFAGTASLFLDLLRTWREMLTLDPSGTPPALDLAGQGFIRG